MTDFIEYPRRVKKGDELCICMHKESDHGYLKDERHCHTCLCDKFKKSKMNGKIQADIESAKNSAKSQLNLNAPVKKDFVWKIEKEVIKES